MTPWNPSTLVESVPTLSRASILRLLDDGRAQVACDDSEVPMFACEILQTGGPELRIAPGDRVLVWLSPATGDGVVLGRLDPNIARHPTSVEACAGDPGPSLTTTRDVPAPANETPESLVLEAKHSLTLRVGEGSITIREDGKILIKGKDLVSHAQRMNRIKGGAVSIN